MALFVNQKTKCKIEIYQIASIETTDYAFRSWKEAEKKFNYQDYTCIYTGYTENLNFTLDEVFQELNLNLPEDYRGHSLSVSDIIRVTKDSYDHYYYCDDIGWKDVGSVWRMQIRKQNQDSKPEPEYQKVWVRDVYDEGLHFMSVFNNITALTKWLNDVFADEQIDVKISLNTAEFENGMLVVKDDVFFDTTYEDEETGRIGEFPRFVIRKHN